jgi:menaquinone-dependent protoporphyrinogen oxidase
MTTTLCEVPVFYATTEGQTRRIAESLAASIQQHGFDSRAIDVSALPAGRLDWSQVRGVALGASLHTGKHQAAAMAFATAHRDALNAVPSAFFSVSLGVASQHPEEADAVRKIARDFTGRAEWRPDEILCVAGRLAYTKYGWLKRFVMKRIAKHEGGPIDTSRDHELTNWADVRRLAADLARKIQSRIAPPLRAAG